MTNRKLLTWYGACTSKALASTKRMGKHNPLPKGDWSIDELGVLLLDHETEIAKRPFVVVKLLNLYIPDAFSQQMWFHKMRLPKSNVEKGAAGFEDAGDLRRMSVKHVSRTTKVIQTSST